MGKQFAFIIDKTDELSLFEYISQTGKIYSDHNGLIEFISIPTDDRPFKYYFSRAEYCDLCPERINNGKEYINSMKAPVIEYRESMLWENVQEIQRGRIYYQNWYYDDDGVIIKKDEFLDQWYKELVRWLKKKLVCVNVNRFGGITKEYVSESLVDYVEKGYKLL